MDAGLDQDRPGLPTAHPVGPQATCRYWKASTRPGCLAGRLRDRRRSGSPGRRAVAVGRRPRRLGRPAPVGARRSGFTGPLLPSLSTRPRPARADTGLQEWIDSSWSSWPLPLAPMIRCTGSPSLNRINVGMLITSKRRVTSRLSSMLSLAILSRPASSWAISSRVGAIILHGPHHSAQKSTSTGTSEALICSSKLASVRLMILVAHGERLLDRARCEPLRCCQSTLVNRPAGIPLDVR